MTDHGGVRGVFVGPRGLRTGWRLALFVALVTVPSVPVTVFFSQQSPRFLFSPMGIFAGKAVTFVIVLAATWAMARVEHRDLGAFGLPLVPGSGRRMLRGLAWGGGAVMLLIGGIALTGGARVSVAPIAASEAAVYAGLWAGAMVATAFAEEYLTRGYSLVTLSDGIGFWPAAVLLSAAFGLIHVWNPGETWVGITGAALFGLLLCYTVRVTGSLWLAVGIHTAWNWGETFLFGVPNSGIVAEGHLLTTSLHGPAWLTGGSVGPEASLLGLPVLVLLFVGIRFVAWPDGRPPAS